MEGAHTVLRVERGRAGAEELAAVTAVLLALRAGDQAHSGPQDALAGRTPDGPPAAEWSWWASVPDFTPPGSWR
ncbi:acyl-CoA carboxylase subunit epsilon [Streptomyces longwoodensis]|uniref:acyl-CoA carboxylase subunit epsilon n=1 Tax=Streptomyces longwoodensis TaxID=68231 RepID=UPI002DDC5F6A|nr:acyl-CoA carboxylase subunit epsilon [Streptomyces longwoodensis]WRY92576.1 acyl-CoA carboxylase subunit epsilon [Streptomyces longwoodensis]WUC69442.1 acyl-CoA carboxylase subunit epsilon [Streptomyces longwoodensis]WUC75539.1 acyl-CoA carboxylase subunit epsilon [Streptomyces longwoodensis]